MTNLFPSLNRKLRGNANAAWRQISHGDRRPGSTGSPDACPRTCSAARWIFLTDELKSTTIALLSFYLGGLPFAVWSTLSVMADEIPNSPHPNVLTLLLTQTFRHRVEFCGIAVRQLPTSHLLRHRRCLSSYCTTRVQDRTFNHRRFRLAGDMLVGRGHVDVGPKGENTSQYRRCCERRPFLHRHELGPTHAGGSPLVP